MSRIYNISHSTTRDSGVGPHNLIHVEVLPNLCKRDGVFSNVAYSISKIKWQKKGRETLTR